MFKRAWATRQQATVPTPVAQTATTKQPKAKQRKRQRKVKKEQVSREPPGKKGKRGRPKLWSPKRVSHEDEQAWKEIESLLPSEPTAPKSFQLFLRRNPQLTPEKALPLAVGQMSRSLKPSSVNTYTESIASCRKWSFGYSGHHVTKATTLFGAKNKTTHVHSKEDRASSFSTLPNLIEKGIPEAPFMAALAVTGNRPRDISRARRYRWETNGLVVDWGIRKVRRKSSQLMTKSYPYAWTFTPPPDVKNVPTVPSKWRDKKQVATYVNAWMSEHGIQGTSSVFRDHLDAVLRKKVAEKQITEREYADLLDHNIQTGASNYTEPQDVVDDLENTNAEPSATRRSTSSSNGSTSERTGGS